MNPFIHTPIIFILTWTVSVNFRQRLRLVGCTLGLTTTVYWQCPNKCSCITNGNQALQYRIWDLPQESSIKAKFGTLGLFWDHFYTLLGVLVIIFIKLPQNLQKVKQALKTVLSRRLMQRAF